MKKSTSYLSLHNYFANERFYRVVRCRYRPTSAPGCVVGLALLNSDIPQCDKHYYNVPDDVHIEQLPSMRVLSKHAARPGEWRRFQGLTGNRHVKVGEYVYNLAIANLLATAPILQPFRVVQFPGGAEALELITVNETIYVARCLYKPRRTLRLED